MHHVSLAYAQLSVLRSSLQAKHVDAVLLESKLPKEAIVKYVEVHKVDNLILGRRGMRYILTS